MQGIPMIASSPGEQKKRVTKPVKIWFRWKINGTVQFRSS